MSSRSPDKNNLIEIDDIRADLTAQAQALIDATLAESTVSTKPKLIHLCGIPGAGKTTYSDFFLKHNAHFALVQFDSVMEKLSGYRDALSLAGPAYAFGQFELPARIIGYHLLQALVHNRRDIFFDHGALNRQHVGLLKSVSERGYFIEMHYIDCSLEQAFERIGKREKAQSRHTPAAIVHERHGLLQELLPLYKDLVDEFVQIDSSVYRQTNPGICTPVANKEECVE
jgi:predicted ABC-type ATPase